MLTGFEERIEDNQELAHAGDLDNHVGFAGGLEAIGEGAEDGVVSPGSEGGHVECGADVFASAGDAAFAFESAAVVVVGGEAGECGDLAAVSETEFGDFGEELPGGGVTDAGNTAEDIAAGLPVVAGIEEFRDGFLDIGEEGVEQLEGLLQGLAGECSVGRLEAVGFHRSELDDLSSASDEILQFLLIRGDFLGQAGAGDLGEMGEEFGIEGIGLGELSEGFGEVSGLAGIDDGDGESGVDEVTDEGAFVSAGSFDDDDGDGGVLAETFGELFETGLIVGAGPSLGQGTNMDVELGLSDIDSDVEGNLGSVDGTDPVLQIRTRGGGSRGTVLAAVRAGTRGAAAIRLCGGV